jgi:lipoate---protein ligase
MTAEEAPIASWSTVTSPCLVLGRSGHDTAAIEAAARAEGLPVVRRSSGGGPVLWDTGLLALDVVLPRGHPLDAGDVTEAYRWLGEALAGGLRALGAPAVELVEVPRARATPPRPADVACFGALSPYEVLAGGRKVVGLSQARRRQGTLLQAGLLLDLEAARLARVLGGGDRLAADLAAAAAGLRELVPGIDADDVVAAVDPPLVAAVSRARRDPPGARAPGAGGSPPGTRARRR